MNTRQQMATAAVNTTNEAYRRARQLPEPKRTAAFMEAAEIGNMATAIKSERISDDTAARLLEVIRVSAGVILDLEEYGNELRAS